MLPISKFLPLISRKLATRDNLVLQAEPGAGKSTALPLSLMNADWLEGKKILMLEPRRVAVKSIAHYLAKQLGERVGQSVGYQIKNDRKVSKDTVLEIVTEGILTRRLQYDPEIPDIGLIIFDEFHERSVHADLALLLSLEIQQTIREDLKLLVMSATIDTGLVSGYMEGADIIECPGKAFPVSVDYTKSTNAPLAHQVINALRTVLSGNTDGDILVFLPGQSDINRCIKESGNQLGAIENLLFLPLYGGLPLSQQERAITPDSDGRRRVVFTTNIAETSLTIEGVTCVIDSGLEKVLIYDPKSCMTRLETLYISDASAKQRKGRAGRTQPGTCIRLWDQQKSLRDYQGEEILSADLTGLVLELCEWGAGDYHDINWLTPPPESHYLSAQETLISLGLMDSEHKITALGTKAVHIGLPPRLAAMLLQAEGVTEQSIACELASLLADRDIFYHHKSVDIVERLLAVQDYKVNPKTALRTYPVKHSSIEHLLASSNSLRRVVKIEKSTSGYSLMQLQDSVGKLLLYAYPDRLARKRTNTSGRYLLANGRGVTLFDDDPLLGSEWLVIADCDAQKKEGRIFNAAPTSTEWVLESLGEHFVEKNYFEFDRTKQKITGRSVTKYGAIELQSTAISEIPPETFRKCLFQIFQDTGLDVVLNWTPRCEDWLSRAQWLGKTMDAFPRISKDTLIDNLESWLLPYLSGVNSIKGLRKINVYELLLGTLSWEEQTLLNREAPTDYITPGNRSVPIMYDSQQGPTVSVQLQEMFGQIDAPRLGGGKVPIRFELLSPARRPIQTTSDLGTFWKTSYFDVAKDMRGRYPKHRWPENPLLEKAGRSIKRKKCQ